MSITKEIILEDVPKLERIQKRYYVDSVSIPCSSLCHHHHIGMDIHSYSKFLKKIMQKQSSGTQSTDNLTSLQNIYSKKIKNLLCTFTELLMSHVVCYSHFTVSRSILLCYCYLFGHHCPGTYDTNLLSKRFTGHSQCTSYDFESSQKEEVQQGKKTRPWHGNILEI